MEKELGVETGPLSKQVKRLNFGQFLFLYFVARNSDTEFCSKLLQELRLKGAPDWAKTKGQKDKDIRMTEINTSRKESALPSYDSSTANIPAQSEMKEEPQAPPLEPKTGLVHRYPELSYTEEGATMKKT